MQYRTEHDSMGEIQVPADRYWGAQTQRSFENFKIGAEKIPMEIIRAFAILKKAAAMANHRLGKLDETRLSLISAVCDEILAGKLDGHFPLAVWQTGSGTQSNMNVNEVIANRAIELLGGEKGDYALVNPNDHVNYGQSTNDVFPSAGKLAVLKLLVRAQIQLERLSEALEAKAEEFDDVLKMGRTQMQDAVPIRLGQEFRAYSWVVRRDIARFERAKDEMRRLNMGGTAIGTGINADERYLRRIIPNLSKVTGLELVQASDLIDATQNLDGLVAVSGAVKTCAVNLSKMSNDLRLMSSGPRCGFSEINLPPRQNGSSIMPGKVNPVIPEVVSQVAFNIIGNDVTVTMAAEAGQLELNAFEPVLLYSLFESAELLRNAVRTFVDHCVTGIRAERENCRRMVERSAGVAAALCPLIGYERSAALAKEAVREEVPVRLLAEREGVLPAEQLQEVLEPLHMTGPARCGA